MPTLNPTLPIRLPLSQSLSASLCVCPSLPGLALSFLSQLVSPSAAEYVTASRCTRFRFGRCQVMTVNIWLSVRGRLFHTENGTREGYTCQVKLNNMYVLGKQIVLRVGILSHQLETWGAEFHGWSSFTMQNNRNRKENSEVLSNPVSFRAVAGKIDLFFASRKWPVVGS